MLLWLVFGVVVVICARLLLQACGVRAGPLDGVEFCARDGSGAWVSEVERGRRLQAEADGLAAELARRNLACTAQVLPRPSPLALPERAAIAPQQTAELPPLPEDRWRARDLSVLEGCWILGHNVAITRKDMRTGRIVDHCTAVAGRLCFDRAGNGTNDQRTVCPVEPSVTCTAPLTAQFAADGTLRARQPQVQCRGADVAWMSQTMTCRRVNETTAVCATRDAQGNMADLEFRRGR